MLEFLQHKGVFRNPHISIDIGSITILISYFESEYLISKLIIGLKYSISLNIIEPKRITLIDYLRSTKDLPIIRSIYIGACIKERWCFVETKEILYDGSRRIHTYHISVYFVFRKGEALPHLKVFTVRVIVDESYKVIVVSLPKPASKENQVYDSRIDTALHLGRHDEVIRCDSELLIKGTHIGSLDDDTTPSNIIAIASQNLKHTVRPAYKWKALILSSKNSLQTQR